MMSASLAMAGMTACTKQPLEPIVPYVRQPEDVIPGRPMFYATAFELSGYATPVLVESHLFRPTKIEGNAQHPASQGGTDIYAQASILGMYDPDRSQTITYLGETRTWGAFIEAFRGPLTIQKGLGGAGIRILTQATSSPTLADQMRSLLKAFPQAKWHVYDTGGRDNVLAGAQMAFGQPVETQYKLDAADVIVSLDADFLSSGFPGMTRYARDFAARRNPDAGTMNRLYVVESAPSGSGAKADHHLTMRSAEIEGFARALATALGVNAGGGALQGEAQKYLDAITKELQAHRGSSVVIAGDHQSPAVHALAHAINQALGNVGRTVIYTDPIDANPINQAESLKDLVADMRGGKVDVLIILGGNPAYESPADFGFADALKNTNIPMRVHLGLYNDETAELCQWHINETHYLEQWGDTRAYDGSVSIVQPLIAPLYSGKSKYEFVSYLAGQGDASGHDIVRAYWQKQHAGQDFEVFWKRALHDGWVQGTAFTAKRVAPKPNFVSPASVDANALEINYRRDPSTFDGRFANNGWLQELPKPMTKLTWDNPVMMGPAMADRLGIKTEDVIKISLNGKTISAPVWIQAGHADKSITVFLGYGRTRAGRVGTGAGYNAYDLRYSATPWLAAGVTIEKTGETYKLASTQGYQTMETPVGERPLVRTTSLDDYKKNPEFAREEEPEADETLYPHGNGHIQPEGWDYTKEPYAWGMAIDLNKCVGCNNCIVACQSENNIPIVGKEQVNRGRHMHWIRVDAYYQGDRDNPRAHFQPVPCMQCEAAPCELVCPVGATVHSTEGLNDMVYNCCVGTRYCSNNCPYKVRRFNFLLFQDWETPQLKMMRNPDVSVRSRGVMEKCTYCVQRINQHRIDSEREDRKIADGELQTACQQSCPANAIVFGNINDPNSQVSKWKQQSRNYSLLADLNTRPRTTYLAEVKNPNPELQA